MLHEQHQRWRKEAGVLSGREFKWGQNFFLLKRLFYLNNKWQYVHCCQGLLKGNQAGLSKAGTKGFELFSVINNSELSTADSCKSHLCFHACEQFGLWIYLLWSEAHSILKKKKKLASELHLSIKVLENESLQASARPYVTYLVQCKSLIGGLKSF